MHRAVSKHDSIYVSFLTDFLNRLAGLAESLQGLDILIESHYGIYHGSHLLFKSVNALLDSRKIRTGNAKPCRSYCRCKKQKYLFHIQCNQLCVSHFIIQR